MLRWMMFGCVALFGLSEVAPAATISAVLKPDVIVPGTGSVPTKVGYATRTGGGETTPYYFGTVLKARGEEVVKDEIKFNSNNESVAVRTDFNEETSPSNWLFKLTTYAWFQYNTSPSIPTSETYFIQNKAFVEFTINGNYDWNIVGSDPTTSNAFSSSNRREFRFVKDVGGVEQELANDTTGLPPDTTPGTGATHIPSTTQIGTGTYRLYFDHYDTYKYDNLANAANLNISFTLKSEDGGGSGVVPEPSSVAVFGLLSLGSAVAKWRRKKSQLAA